MFGMVISAEWYFGMVVCLFMPADVLFVSRASILLTKVEC